MKNAYKAFVVFEIVLSLIITNALFIFGSIISLGILFPVLLTSIMNYIKRAYTYREYEGIIFTFFAYIKGNILRSFKLIYPILLFIIFLLINLLYLNGIMYEQIDGNIVVLIYILQSFVLYQLIQIMLHISIILTRKEELDSKTIFREAFILVNKHPIRSFFSFVSLIIMGITTLFNIDYLYVIFIPFSLFAFYVVNTPILKEHLKQQVHS